MSALKETDPNTGMESGSQVMQDNTCLCKSLMTEIERKKT